MSPTYRVVQWGAGNIGGRALREVIQHPDLELVGLVVYHPDKVGVDAGKLCGEGPVGVLATDDRSSIAALGADCVLYMPAQPDLAEVLALLDAGSNVITTCGAFFARCAGLGADGAQAVGEACRKGGSSIYATGSSPGFITEVIAAGVLSLQRRVSSVTIEEYADMSQRDSPQLLFDLMGFGAPIGPVDPARPAHLLGSFGPTLAELAAQAGRPVDDWSAHGEVAAVRADTKIAAGELAAGTVAGQRTTLIGRHGDDEVVRFIATWYCSHDLDADWDLMPTGWRVKVDGDAPLDVSLPFPVAAADLGAVTPAYTANRPVNAIPYVCRAAPGILGTEDLPPITPAGPRT